MVDLASSTLHLGSSPNIYVCVNNITYSKNTDLRWLIRLLLVALIAFGIKNRRQILISIEVLCAACYFWVSLNDR